MPKKHIVDTRALLELNPDFTLALYRGERWATEHMRICQSLNDGEPEGFRRPFDGKPRKWCGGACTSPEGCVMCTLPEDPEMARFNRAYKNPAARAHEGVIVISGEIDDNMVDRVSEMLARAHRNQVEELEIRITSGGGDVTAGLKIYDMLRAAPVKVRRGIVSEYARSMAAIILQACEERIAEPNARILIHHTHFDKVTVETLRSPAKIRFMLLCAESDEQRMDELLVRRTRRSLAEIKAICDKDTDMTSQEALAFGLIDAIR